MGKCFVEDSTLVAFSRVFSSHIKVGKYYLSCESFLQCSTTPHPHKYLHSLLPSWSVFAIPNMVMHPDATFMHELTVGKKSMNK